MAWLRYFIFAPPTSVLNPFVPTGTSANTVFYGILGLVFLAFFRFFLSAMLVLSGRFEHPAFGERVKLSNIGFNKCKLEIVSLPFALGHTQCGFMNRRMAYTKIQHISIVDVTSFALSRFYQFRGFLPLKRPCIRIHVAGKRAPIEVMLDVRMKREAEWLVEQIQARMAAAQSGTVPEDLMRLTRQVGETESSTGSANASATQQTT